MWIELWLESAFWSASRYICKTCSTHSTNPEKRRWILQILYVHGVNKTTAEKQGKYNTDVFYGGRFRPHLPLPCDHGRINSNKNSQRSTWNFPQIAKNKITHLCVRLCASVFLVKTSWKMHPMRRSKNASLYLTGAWSSAFHFPNFHMFIERQTATATATLEWRWRHKWHGSLFIANACVSARFMESICTFVSISMHMHIYGRICNDFVISTYTYKYICTYVREGTVARGTRFELHTNDHCKHQFYFWRHTPHRNKVFSTQKKFNLRTVFMCQQLNFDFSHKQN